MPRAGPQGKSVLTPVSASVGIPRGGEHGKAVLGWWRFDSAASWGPGAILIVSDSTLNGFEGKVRGCRGADRTLGVRTPASAIILLIGAY
jgi:hypothetical protein